MVDAANRLRASTMEAIRRYTAAKVLGVSPSASPKVTAPVPAGTFADLLEHVDPRRYAVRGEWGFVPSTGPGVAGGLRVKPGLHARLALPAQVTGDYDLEVDFTRTAGEDGMMLILPVGRGNVGLVTAWHGDANGLNSVWFEQLSGNAGGQPCRIVNNRPYRLRAMVRLLPEGRCRVEATLDGRPCITGWEGPQDALRTEWHLPPGARLGIGAHDAEYVFHRVRLRPVDADAHLLEFQVDRMVDPVWTDDGAREKDLGVTVRFPRIRTVAASPDPPRVAP
jgi:hypothetical protein